jgi:DNA modification methylase
MTSKSVSESTVKYITKIEKKESIKPVFKTDDFCLYQDDFLNVMVKFPDNYVDMIFADPPYMLSNTIPNAKIAA